MQRAGRWILLTLGWVFFALGMIGAFLPVVPTTPFLIVSAFCFSKSSDRLHRWLLNRPYVGSAIKDWEKFGVIRKKSKALATIAILVGSVYPLFFGPLKEMVRWILAGVFIAVLLFIWTRPSSPPREAKES